MSLLAEKEIFQGELADYWMEDGILYSKSKSPKRTIANVSANAELVKKIAGNKRVPLLIYLCNSPIPDKATREFSRQQLPVNYTSMAMVSKPGLSQLIMNILFKLNKPPIPMKSFTDDAEARKWLQQFH
jgi:hypothetical protein